MGMFASSDRKKSAFEEFLDNYPLPAVDVDPAAVGVSVSPFAGLQASDADLSLVPPQAFGASSTSPGYDPIQAGAGGVAPPGIIDAGYLGYPAADPALSAPFASGGWPSLNAMAGPTSDGFGQLAGAIGDTLLSPATAAVLPGVTGGSSAIGASPEVSPRAAQRQRSIRR